MAAAAAAAQFNHQQPQQQQNNNEHLSALFASLKNQLAAVAAVSASNVTQSPSNTSASSITNMSSVSSNSSGYSTSILSEENNNNESKNEPSSLASPLSSAEQQQHQSAAVKSGQAASLAHIMNWIKNTSQITTPESFIELSSRVYFGSIRWAKTQRNLLALNPLDQNIILNENLNELFLLHLAENKSILNESKSFILHPLLYLSF
jgi:hypothetical protein